MEQNGYLVAGLFQFLKIVFLKKAIPPKFFPMDFYEFFTTFTFTTTPNEYLKNLRIWNLPITWSNISWFITIYLFCRYILI